MPTMYYNFKTILSKLLHKSAIMSSKQTANSRIIWVLPGFAWMLKRMALTVMMRNLTSDHSLENLDTTESTKLFAKSIGSHVDGGS